MQNSEPLSDQNWHCLLLPAALLCLALTGSGQAAAQQESSIFAVAPDSIAATLPASATDVQAIAIDLNPLAAGSGHLLVQIDGSSLVQLQVTTNSLYANGDQLIRATTVFDDARYSLVLTVGQGHLFGHLSSVAGSWQLYAEGQAGLYRGWQYRSRGLTSDGSTLHNDYWIPDPARLPRPDRESSPRLPLQNPSAAAAPAALGAAVSSADVDASTFRVIQTFDHSSVLVGATVTAELRFENTSTQTYSGLFAEVYFLLENSTLVGASAACSEQLSLSLQKVLACNLGNFAPGQIKRFSYSVAITEQSRPQVVSTVVIGSLRLDSFINVVNDVRSDRDGDGVSDYNENLTGTDPDNPASVDRSDTVIDVMAFYTPGAKQAYPLGVETRINQLISVANQAYADSGVGITLRTVFQGEVNYSDSSDMDTALDAIIYNTDPAFAGVADLRRRYGGDLVMLFRPLGQGADRCGLAPVGGYNTSGDFSAATEKQFGFALIGIDCPSDIVVAHELGHNMGLTHSQEEEGRGGTFDFSTGYGVPEQFVTIMALPAAFNTGTRLAQFSNPLQSCLGLPCGRDEALPAPADAVRSLNLTKYQIANYFATTVPDLPQQLIATWSGAPTTASIALAASHDNGLSYDSVLTPDDSVDVFAEIVVDDRHAGARGNIYVLVGLENGEFYQQGEVGGLRRWDGTEADLVPFAADTVLYKRERLDLLDGYQFDAAAVGQELRIYIAYLVSATGEVVYTATPLVLKVQAGN